jgi:hypothetical protein
MTRWVDSMSEVDLANALARLEHHHNLHLPLRRSDLFGRLALRFLWKRHLKWQLEVNIATRDAVDNLNRLILEMRQKIRTHGAQLTPIVDSIGIGTGLATNVGVNKEFDKLRQADQNVIAGLNQRIYAAIGGMRADLSDLRLELAQRQDGSGEFELRLKEAEERLARLDNATRDLRLRHTHLDLYLDELRSAEPAAAQRPAAVPDRGSFIELAVAELLDGPVEEVSARRRSYLQVVEAARKGHPAGAVFDLAPGRGEWLESLRTLGIPAEAASPNPYVVRHCATLGIELRQAEPLDVLAARDKRSLAAITAFRYVERLDPAGLTRFVDLAATALRRGGVLIVETPHAGPAARDFHLDPFATKPVHPDLLRFLVDAAGFSTAEVRYVDDGPLADWPENLSAPAAAKADRYCLLAWR